MANNVLHTGTANEFDTAEAVRLTSIFWYYRTSRLKWATRAKELKEMTYNDVDGTGTQLNSAQLQEVKERYLIPITVNIMSPIKEQLKAFLTANRPIMNVLPVGRSSKQFSYVWQELLKAVSYSSNQSRELAASIDDMLIAGHGFLFPAPNHFFRHNIFNCNIKSIPWEYVYIDPMSIQPDYQDAEYQIIAMPIRASKAKKIYGLTNDQITFAGQELGTDHAAMWQELQTLTGFPGAKNEDKLMWFKEFYEKTMETVYILKNGQMYLGDPTAQFVGPDAKVGSYQDLIQYETKDVILTRRWMVGNLIISAQKLPIKKYMLAPIQYNWNRSPYPSSPMFEIRGLNDLLSKALISSVEHTQKSGNTKILFAEGSISDKKKVEKDSSQPGAWIGYKPDPEAYNNGLPVPVYPAQLNQGWYKIIEQIFFLIEYNTGIFGLMQGNSAGAPGTLGAHQSLTNFGTQRVQLKARNIQDGLQDLYEVIVQFMQHFSPRKNILRYMQGSDTMVEIETDVQIKLQDEQLIEAPDGEMATIIRNQANEIIDVIFGSVEAGEYQIRFAPGTDLPTTRQQAIGVLNSVLARTSDDAIAIAIGEALLELSEMPEADRILRKTNIVRRLQQQIQQQAEELKQAQKVAKAAENKAKRAEDKALTAETEAEVDKMKNKLQSGVDTAMEEEKAKEAKVYN